MKKRSDKICLISLFMILSIAFVVFAGGCTTTSGTTTKTTDSNDDVIVEHETTTVEIEAKAPTTKVYVERKENTPALSNETMGQKNAVKKAKSYLEFSAFSHDGLVEQLEYEQFSHEEAVYGADHCGADWKEQAVKKAKSYLDFSSFSRDGLIEQLEYEKFTHEQAVYGAEQNGY